VREHKRRRHLAKNVYFINLKDGAELKSPFLAQFELSGMGVAAAPLQPTRTTTKAHKLKLTTVLRVNSKCGFGQAKLDYAR
jgi:hypothetical protein